MKMQRSFLLFVAAAFWSQGAIASEVRIYGQGEIPTREDVAAILAPQRQPTKLRSLRLLGSTPSSQTTHSAEAASGDRTGPHIRSFALPIQFSFDSNRILGMATAQLDAVAEGIKLAGPRVRVVIEGHTDALGSDEYNLVLAFKRAMAVKTYLVQRHGVEPDSLRVVALGEAAPLNRANPSAPENRRVEFRAESA
jgi:outer membrane protein OmpA-like peptidoglycan-associated protein